MIPFEENEYGLNPGRYIELYQTHLNPKRNNMFQLPRTGKKFRRELHRKKKGREIYYANQKVGKTYVGYFMPKVKHQTFLAPK